MEKTAWKIIGIIFFVLFIAETSLIVWGIILIENEEEKTMECYYEICDEYPKALLEENLCTCYEYDMWGENLLVAKQKYMK